jgi:hypothetical protein
VKTTPEERERLIEEVVSAHRAADPRGGHRPSPAFADLDEAGRQEAFERTLASRALEAALDPEGLSTTARLLLLRVRAGG